MRRLCSRLACSEGPTESEMTLELSLPDDDAEAAEALDGAD